MATYRAFEDLDVWKSSRMLTRMTYDVTNLAAFRPDRGLRDQMQRAAVSVMSNIAEGFESRTTAQFIDYLGRSRASAGELRSQLYVAFDLNYIDAPVFEETKQMALLVSRQLFQFAVYLRKSPFRRRTETGG